MKRQLIGILFATALTSCSTTYSPQAFYQGELAANQKAIILNEFTDRTGLQSSILSINDKDVGNRLRGVFINELHVPPGRYRMDVTMILTGTFTTNITCELEAGYFYTIGQVPSGQGQRVAFPSPTEYRTRNTAVDINQQTAEVGCVKYDKMPKNENLERFIRGRNAQVSSEYYRDEVLD